MARLALSIRPKAEVIEMPVREVIKAAQVQISMVWIGILVFIFAECTGALYFAYLLWRTMH